MSGLPGWHMCHPGQRIMIRWRAAHGQHTRPRRWRPSRCSGSSSDAIGNRDYAVVQACLLLLVVIFIVINLVTDVLYGVIDPGIRLAGGRSR